MFKGSCLCGAVTFETRSRPKSVTHCHCRMCQKQHGAAFATYASIPRADLVYLSGEDELTAYNSSACIERKFCKHCGSNIEWSGSEKYPEWVSIVVASLDNFSSAETVTDIHLDAKAAWCDNS